MQITLGLDLDSGAFPDALGENEAACGATVLGPLGFLGVLETQLGLGGVVVHQAVRIAQYLKLLTETDDDGRFYSASLKSDAWSTAKQVLGWRDELRLAGWSGVFQKGASPRLAVLAQIENRAEEELSAGLADRLREVHRVLSLGRPVDIHSVRLVDPLDLWPHCWRRIFDCLERGVVLFSDIGIKASSGANTDLGRLQQALLNGGRCTEESAGDGSLILVRSETEEEAAECIASWLAAKRDGNDDVLFLRGSGSAVLDNRLHRFGLPGLGTDSRSRWRMALQVLPLVLSNLWAPFNPYRLLDLLSLPKSPIPGFAARLFEDALREHPGIGGPLWQEARDKALAGFRTLLEGNGLKGGQLDKQLDQFREELCFWLGETRYDTEKGLPVEMAVSVCDRVKDWAARRGGEEDDGLLLTVASLSSHVARALEASGQAIFSKAQLDRVLDTVFGEGAENPASFPEAAPWAQVSAPGQIWGPAGTIVWWNCTASDRGSFRMPWTMAERDAIEAQGARLQSPAEKRAREAQSWLKPVLMAKEHLLLVAPGRIQGTAASPHSFWDEVRYRLCLDESPASLRRIALSSAPLRSASSWELAGRVMEGSPVKCDPLPRPKREWTVPANGDWIKGAESYSRMSKLLECPFAWFLRYVLGARSGVLVTLPDGNGLLGTLSHKILEALLKESSSRQPADAERRAMELYDILLPQMAAPLLQPGRELERERNRATMGQAAERFFTLVNDSGMSVKGFEEPLQKVLPGPAGGFYGRADVLLKTSDGRKAVWDLKWSGTAKYKRQEIEGGRALQLAAYAWLLSESGREFPPAAYFMLAQGELLSTSCEGIPKACQFADVDLESIWEKAFAAYKERLNELKTGLISAAGVNLNEVPEAVEPAPKIPGEDVAAEERFEVEAHCDWCEYAILCGSGGV